MTATAQLIRSARRVLKRYGAERDFRKRTTTGTKAGGLTPAVGTPITARAAFVPTTDERSDGRSITRNQAWIDAAPFVAATVELDADWTTTVDGKPIGFEDPVIVHRPEPAASPVVFQATVAS